MNLLWFITVFPIFQTSAALIRRDETVYDAGVIPQTKLSGTGHR
jgi:hypothetical protein